jgi:hypothetical protein
MDSHLKDQRFRECVTAIVELEDRILIGSDFQDPAWLDYHIRALHDRYEGLHRLWPIVAGGGTPEELPERAGSEC